MTVLVACASEHGSTRDVSERLAARLWQRGLAVDLAALGDDPDPARYRALVLGSAVHDGAWLPEAADYVRRRQTELATRPVWMFSVGMTAALPLPLRMLALRTEQPAISRVVESVAPRGHRRLSGVIRPDHLDRRGRIVFRLLGCRYGDHRDWAEIDAWADGVATALGA
ncbi:flavodoxin domain-containing protein [Streptomyces sp. NPDC046939]|uniref:flavodoxin domain-containing protein n=1 Tax=Streptomyces sp. NPDC046939 TaxID=3155376 RepID=UPI0033C04101